MPFFLMTLCLLMGEPRLTETLGRNNWLVYSEPFPITSGRSIFELDLETRLKSLGYRRVKNRPQTPGTYFWGRKNFWVFRKSHHFLGKQREPELFIFRLDSKSRIVGLVQDDKTIMAPIPRGAAYLEPQILSESLVESRYRLEDLPFKAYPEMMWRALLAAEDSRFFEHHGLDSKAIARSLLKNIKAGKVVMGGSTITQQLIKNRDLTPKRTMRRKANEAIRALILESEYEKDDILEAYMNHVYLGHVNGTAIYGFPAASQVYFSRPIKDLTLAEYATLAAMVQGPNLFKPHKSPERCRKRRNWVLSRMKTLGWISESKYAKAKSEPIRAKLSKPSRQSHQHVLTWIHQLLKDKHRHFSKGRGGRIYTTLDPILQVHAQRDLTKQLKRLKSKLLPKSISSLEGALVSMDLETGGILAYCSASTAPSKEAFDRVRLAKRQPGSTVKPFVLLAAFNRFSDPLFPGTLVQDSPVVIDTKPKAWRPTNYDDRYHGTVSVREALVQSYNVPFAKIGRHIGFEVIGDQMKELGLQVPNPVPPSISLGSVEVSPLQLLEAFSVFFRNGDQIKARPLLGYDKPSGKKIRNTKQKHRKRVRKGSAYLVYDLLKDVMERGTGQPAHLADYVSAGKTGTSSDYRDAWFVGQAGSVLTVVWVGCDNNQSTNLPSSQLAAPIWRTFMNHAVPLRPDFIVEKPGSIKTCDINPKTGLRVWGLLPGSTQEIYRRGGAPDREKVFGSKPPNRID